MEYDRNYYESLPPEHLLQHLDRIPNKSEILHACQNVIRAYADDESELQNEVKQLKENIADEEQLTGELETELKNLKEKFTQLKATREDQNTVITEIDTIFENLNKEKGI